MSEREDWRNANYESFPFLYNARAVFTHWSAVEDAIRSTFTVEEINFLFENRLNGPIGQGWHKDNQCVYAEYNVDDLVHLNEHIIKRFQDIEYILQYDGKSYKGKIKVFGPIPIPETY